MKTIIRTGATVIFFAPQSEAESLNKNQVIAPAVIVGRPLNSKKEELDLRIFFAQPNDGYGENIDRAETLIQALTQGYCWATIETCEEWRIDLSRRDQDLNLLLPSGVEGRTETTMAIKGDGE